MSKPRASSYKLQATSYQLPNHIHLIGIGGSGMSGLARILKTSGKNISGSNDQISTTTAALKSEKISVQIGHQAKNIPVKTELVIYSAAVPAKNPELIEAKKRGLPTLTYAEAVGILTRTKKTICISGTHGKTTTTAMSAAVFLKTKKDPTVIIGSTIKELDNRNARCGKSPYFILESCEYRRAFLNFQPEIIIITNIEADHLDYYHDLQDYKKAFQQFIAKLQAKKGLLIANGDDKNIRQIISKTKNLPQIIWYGQDKNNDYQLDGATKSVFYQNKKVAELNLKIPGVHNLMNATAVLALAQTLKFPLKQTLAALENYQGSSRRFEFKGKLGKTILIDDYAHHPTEIKATLAAARQKFGPTAKILCIFQPHQYSRTLKLLAGFAKSFSDADEVIIPNIYEVRDSAKDIQAINAATLVKKIQKYQPNVRNGEGFAKTIAYVKKNAHKFDVILTLGAGNIADLAKRLTK